MGLPDRVYQLAKGYLDQALSRWDQIDARAQAELDESADNPTPSAWDRARAKIENAKAANEAAKSSPQAPMDQRMPPLAPPAETPMPSANRPASSLVEAAYTIIGVPAGSDFPTVQIAYQKLKERASPGRFPADSPDHAKARQIERRIDAAYRTLMDALAPSEDRFDRLEL